MLLKKEILIFSLIIVFIYNCGQNKTTSSEASSNKEYADLSPNGFSEPNLGQYVYSIEFYKQGDEDDKEIFEDGKIPWVSLENAESDINIMFDKDEIVIKENEIEILFDYPLDNPISIRTKSDRGFTRSDLLSIISDKYKQIYREEESSAHQKTVPLNERKGLINRNSTDGKYGICCHDLIDLDLGAIDVFKDKNGIIKLVLYIES